MVDWMLPRRRLRIHFSSGTTGQKGKKDPVTKGAHVIAYLSESSVCEKKDSGISIRHGLGFKSPDLNRRPFEQ